MSEKKKVKSVLIFSEWQTLIQNLTDEQAGQLVKAMCYYNKGEDYTAPDPVVTAMFAMIREGMDSNNSRYEEVCRKRAEAGKKGAEARWENDSNSHSENGKCHSEDGKRCKTQTQTQTINQTKTQSVTPNGDKREKVTSSPKRETASRFRPPTVEEVEAYCFERNNKVDPERFVDFYSSNGWKVGKNPMKDWKAAVRTWEKRDGPNNVVEMTNGQKARQAQNDVLKAMYQGIL